jgi:hypothetical protein
MIRVVLSMTYEPDGTGIVEKKGIVAEGGNWLNVP